jgi:predicted Zn-dependent protease
MSTAPYRSCPACGTRNKPTWEFCVRCGESIGDVAVERAESEAGAETRRRRARIVLHERSSGGLGVSGWLTLAALVPLTVFACRWYARDDHSPATPAPGVFVVATPPPAAAAPAKGMPGLAEFSEGRRLQAAGNLDGAAQAFAQAVAANPTNADYHEAYGDCLAAMGSQDDAIGEYEAAARAAPARGALTSRWAEALIKNDDLSGAAAAYEFGLQNKPNDTGLLRSLASVQVQQDPTAAVATMQRVVGIEPHDLRFRHELGVMQDKAGEYDDAVETLRGVVAAMPSAAQSRSWLAEALLHQGKADEAIKSLQDGIRLNPDGPMLHRSLGSIYERARRPADAARAYRDYVRLAPNAPDAAEIRQRADALDQLGRPS